MEPGSAPPTILDAEGFEKEKFLELVTGVDVPAVPDVAAVPEVEDPVEVAAAPDVADPVEVAAVPDVEVAAVPDVEDPVEGAVGAEGTNKELVK